MSYDNEAQVNRFIINNCQGIQIESTERYPLTHQDGYYYKVGKSKIDGNVKKIAHLCSAGDNVDGESSVRNARVTSQNKNNNEPRITLGFAAIAL